MPNVIRGVVIDGKIVAEQTLPEGTEVQMTVPDDVFIMPPELREELQDWRWSSIRALELVERLAAEMPDEEG
jgi:hypothetical protein